MPEAPAGKPNEHSQDSIDALSLSLIRRARKVKNAAHGDLQSMFQTANIRGLDTDAAKIALKLADQGAEAIDAYFSEFRKVGTYLGLLGKVLAPQQYEMFDPKIGPLPEDERASLEGRAAGFDLDPEMDDSKNPYDIGSIKGQKWLSAFGDARRERDAIMQMKPSEPDTSNTEGDEGKA